MRHQYNLAVVLNGIIFLYTKVSALNHENFKLERNLNREKLINYLSTILCSIDLKSAYMYYERTSNGRLLDDIITETSGCVPLPMTIIRLQKDGSTLPNTNSGAHLIILVLEELEYKQSMFPVLFHLRQKANFNLFYLIISESKLSDNHENLLKVMYRNYNVLNAVIVAMDSECADLTVITYNPFNNTMIRIPNDVYKRKELFFEKNSDLFGNPINIVMYKDTLTSFSLHQVHKSVHFNNDEFLPYLISSKLNGTLILKTPFTKDFDYEDVRKADLTINGRSYSMDALHDVGIEETILMRRDDTCVLVPYNRIPHLFDSLFRAVSSIVWVMMIAVIFLAWISLQTIRWAQHYKTWNRVFLFDLFRFHMFQSLKLTPKRLAPRFIIASWLVYCVIINSILQGSLYNSMANSKDSRISTIDDVIKMNKHELLISDIFYDYAKHFLNDSPIQRLFNVIDFEENLNRLESGKIHYAYILRHRVAKYFENIEIVDGEPVYYTMEECMVPSMTFYFVRRGSPYLSKMNYLLRLFDESGLFCYSEDQLIHAYNKFKQQKRLFTNQTPENLENIGFVFEIWCYGLCLSSATFIFECCVSRFNMRTKKRLMEKFHRIHRMK